MTTKKGGQQTFSRFLLLWVGQFISAIGSGLTSFGLGIYVYEQTNKASLMALVTLCGFIPMLILSPLAGVLADRYDRRLLMILGDSLSLIGLIYLLVVVQSPNVTLWKICLGVMISATFSTLIEPAYKATVSDMLLAEDYTKASGLMQLTSSAKYLISPVIAGLLLTIANIELLILLDSGTIIMTIFTTMVVRKGLKIDKSYEHSTVSADLKLAWQAITQQSGLVILVLLSAILTFLLGFIELLSVPMILSFANTAVVGTIEAIVATGMLVSSVLLSIVPIKKSFTKYLAWSLFGEGFFMILFGWRESIFLLCLSGFLFFAMMPFANTTLDFLIRVNVSPSLQGRVWSLIGVVSQLGFVAAYAFSGLLADYVFTPLLLEDGALASSLGQLIGTGQGRGMGLLIMTAGLFLCILALVIYRLQSIKQLEKEVTYVL
ncbi:MFS transporter [Vagococcus penaei]|uniref:MFS transporter n=1 Tax=Vagococcus penaei TaxID=633807 RepID=A0A1Q2D4C0_9ENTE|nr:MFS transporter [Vagococcus penaei]AQP53171.1 MFS transporter [Vagococcus penaei]